MNNFQITALQDKEFSNLFKLDNRELEKRGVIKMTVDKKPGFPCRVSLKDAEIGEEVILLSYQHHQTNSPYQATGPIFISKDAITSSLDINEIPAMLNHRLLSVRAYDQNGMMRDAIVTEGQNLKTVLIATFSNPEINYIHIHNAKAGCYNCKVERV